MGCPLWQECFPILGLVPLLGPPDAPLDVQVEAGAFPWDPDHQLAPSDDRSPAPPTASGSQATLFMLMGRRYGWGYPPVSWEPRAWVSALSVLRGLTSPRPGMELPAPGIWALSSRLVKSTGFGRPQTRTLALRHRGQEAQKDQAPEVRFPAQHQEPVGHHCSPFPCCAPQIMEVASPTARASVLVELAQLQLLQACCAVACAMSPHGGSADSSAPIAPAWLRPPGR